MDSDQIQGAVQEGQEAQEGQEPEVTPASNVPEGTKSESANNDLGIKERTVKRLEEVLEENKKLKAQLQTPQTSVYESLLGDSTPQAPVPTYTNSAGQQQAVPSSFIDEEGNVDIAGLNKYLQAQEERSKRAEAEALETKRKLERFEQTQEEREAYQVHPELDPQSSSFSRELFELVRDRLVRNMVTGQRQTLKVVAEEIKKSLGAKAVPQQEQKLKEETIKQYEEAQKNRNQGPLESGKGQDRQADADIDELRARTRKGDSSALIERLKRLGI